MTGRVKGEQGRDVGQEGKGEGVGNGTLTAKTAVERTEQYRGDEIRSGGL